MADIAALDVQQGQRPAFLDHADEAYQFGHTVGAELFEEGGLRLHDRHPVAHRLHDDVAETAQSPGVERQTPLAKQLDRGVDPKAECRTDFGQFQEAFGKAWHG